MAEYPSAPNSPLTPCPNCGAIMNCCAMSKMRGESADALSRVVDRQSDTIKTLRRERDEARQVIADLRLRALCSFCEKTNCDKCAHCEKLICSFHMGKDRWCPSCSGSQIKVIR
jgi:hypothetical protein